VVYACDKDLQGEASAQEVSKNYRRSMDIIRYDDKFPMNWDLADPLPEVLYKDRDREKVYIGPRLSDYTKPATWATEKIETGEKGRPQYKLLNDFIDEWRHILKPELYVHVRFPQFLRTATEFNNVVRPFSHVMDVASKVQAHELAKVETLGYRPAAADGEIVHTEFGTAFNRHRKGTIQPRQGDPAKWRTYLENLFPVAEDREHVERWVYTLLCRPDIKMHYGLLLCSEKQGVGKTTLGESIIRPLIGVSNVAVIDEHQITDSHFTYWKANRRLVLVNEIYAGQSSKAYNKLKSVITDTVAVCEEKFVPTYETENWAHMIACSNSMRALKLPDDDRRWLVPKVSETEFDTVYWKEFHDWLTGEGLGIILQYAQDWMKKNRPVLPGERPPATDAKKELIESLRSPGQMLVADWLEENKDKCLVVTDKALVDFIARELYGDRFNEKLERPATIRKLALSCGWHSSRERRKPPSSTSRYYFLARYPEWTEMTPGELLEKRIEIITQIDRISPPK
jgi:hypothetical protein